MCVAIALPANVDIRENVLRGCYEANSDGAGFGYYNAKGEQVIVKGLMQWQPFLEVFNEHRNANKDKNFLVHFRIRTQGARNDANCHPFPLKNGIIIHNGSVNGLGETNYGANYMTAKSDTAEFAEAIYNIPKNRFSLAATKLKDIITWGAVYMLDRKGNFHFVGAKTEKEGAIFSNTHWEHRARAFDGNSTRPTYDRAVRTMGSGWLGSDNDEEDPLGVYRNGMGD